MTIRTRRLLVVGSALLACVGVTAPAAAASTGYHAASMVEMEANEGYWLLTGQDAAQSAPGVNLPDCRPSAAHPYPVVLVHGLDSNQYNNWADLGPTLANAGYCVYSLNYGGSTTFTGGIGPIADSANQVAAFIDQVLASTGATKVDLVGHSEGGLLVEYVPKLIQGMAGKVHSVIALAPPTHGTTLWGAAEILSVLGLRHLVASACAACAELDPNGDAVLALDNGPVAVPGIAYTTIISTHDEAITPYSSAAITEPGVHNELVQDYCPFDPVGHTGLAYDGDVLTLVGNALDPAEGAPVTCSVGSPL